MGLDFARSRPGTFLAGSVVVGFALARFLKASADRRAETSAGGPATRGRQQKARKSASRQSGQSTAAAAPRGNANASAAAGA